MDHKNVAISLMWYFGHLSDREGEDPYKLQVKKYNLITLNNTCMKFHAFIRSVTIHHKIGHKELDY